MRLLTRALPALLLVALAGCESTGIIGSDVSTAGDVPAEATADVAGDVTSDTGSDSPEACIDVAGDWIVTDTSWPWITHSLVRISQTGCDLVVDFGPYGIPGMERSGRAYPDSTVEMHIDDGASPWRGPATSSTIQVFGECDLETWYAFFERI
jgi:hypothetical protein